MIHYTNTDNPIDFPKELTPEEMMHHLRNPSKDKRSLAELDSVIDEIVDRNPDFVEKIMTIVNRSRNEKRTLHDKKGS
jgi:hypothetical protein